MVSEDRFGCQKSLNNLDRRMSYTGNILWVLFCQDGLAQQMLKTAQTKNLSNSFAGQVNSTKTNDQYKHTRNLSTCLVVSTIEQNVNGCLI